MNKLQESIQTYLTLNLIQCAYDLSKLLIYQSPTPETRLLHAQCLYRLSRYDECRNELSKMQPTEQVYHLLGLCCLSSEKYTTGINQMTSFVNNHRNAYLHYLLGEMNFRSNFRDAAIVHFKSAIDLECNLISAHLRLIDLGFGLYKPISYQFNNLNNNNMNNFNQFNSNGMFNSQSETNGLITSVLPRRRLTREFSSIDHQNQNIKQPRKMSMIETSTEFGRNSPMNMIDNSLLNDNNVLQQNDLSSNEFTPVNQLFSRVDSVQSNQSNQSNISNNMNNQMNSFGFQSNSQLNQFNQSIQMNQITQLNPSSNQSNQINSNQINQETEIYNSINGYLKTVDLLSKGKIDTIPQTMKNEMNSLINSNEGKYIATKISLLQKKPTVAVMICRMSIKENQHSMTLYPLFAEGLYKLRQVKELRALFYQLNENKFKAETWIVIGFYCLSLQNKTKAQESFERALKLNYSIETLQYYAYSLYKNEKYQEALKQYFSILSLHPKHVETLISIAKCQMKLNKWKEALTSIEMSLQEIKVVKNVSLYIEICMKLKRWNISQQLINEVCISSNDLEMYLKKVVIMYRQGNSELALEECNQLIEKRFLYGKSCNHPMYKFKIEKWKKKEFYLKYLRIQLLRLNKHLDLANEELKLMKNVYQQFDSVIEKEMERLSNPTVIGDEILILPDWILLF